MIALFAAPDVRAQAPASQSPWVLDSNNSQLGEKLLPDSFQR
jgi:hypothetical protein